MKNVQTLKSLTSFEGSNREMDRYLWIAGAYRAWRAKVAINVELETRFKNPGELAKDLAILTDNLPLRRAKKRPDVVDTAAS